MSQRKKVKWERHNGRSFWAITRARRGVMSPEFFGRTRVAAWRKWETLYAGVDTREGWKAVRVIVTEVVNAR